MRHPLVAAAALALGVLVSPAHAGGDLARSERALFERPLFERPLFERAGAAELVGNGFVVRDGRRAYRDDRRGRRGLRNRCRPIRALRRAKRLGLRRAYVHRFGRRGVVVRGRGWGKPITVRFGRGRGCPIRAVRVR